MARLIDTPTSGRRRIPPGSAPSFSLGVERTAGPSMTPRMNDWSSERGASLVVSLLAMMMLTALGAALVMTTTTETMLTHNFQTGQQTLYAADAGVERGVQDLIREPNWSGILAGARASGFTDDPPRRLPDGTLVDLAALTTTLQSDTDAFYGVANLNRPVWQLYAHGPMASLLPAGQILAQGYVVVWVGDDPGESDNNPALDGNGALLVHAEAFGEGSSHKVVEASAVRTATTSLESGYVAQRGQDEQNRRARKEAVQTPGASLTEMSMSLKTGGIS